VGDEVQQVREVEGSGPDARGKAVENFNAKAKRPKVFRFLLPKKYG